MKLKFQNKFLIYTLLFAVIFRVIGLTRNSIWLDEAETVLFSYNFFSNGFILNYLNPHFLYNFLLKIWTSFFGIGLFSVRFLSVILGVLSVLMMYIFGKKFFNKKVGLISAFLLAFSNIHIYYSQEARSYGLLILLSLIVYYYFVLYLKTTDMRALFMHVLFIAIMFCSNNVTTFISFSLFFLVLSFQSDRVSKLLRLKVNKLHLGLLAIFYLFCNVFLTMSKLLLFQTLSSGMSISEIYLRKANSYSWISDISFIDVVTSLRELFGNNYLQILFLVLFVVGLYMRYKKKAVFRFEKCVLVSWFFITFLGVIAWSFVFFPVFLTRTIVVLIIPFYFYIATVIAQFSQKNIIIVCSLFFVFSLPFFGEGLNFGREPWADVSQYIEEQDGDKAIYLSKINAYPFVYHYSKECFLSEAFPNCEPFVVIEDEFKVGSGDHYVISYPMSYQEMNDVLFSFNESFDLVDERRFVNIYVYHYR